MNVSKVREALIIARDYINDGSLLPQDMNHPYFKVSEAIEEAITDIGADDPACMFQGKQLNIALRVFGNLGTSDDRRQYLTDPVIHAIVNTLRSVAEPIKKEPTKC